MSKASRKARRQRRRKRIRKGIKRVAKKVVKNPVVQSLAKAALSVVPGGGVAITAAGAIKNVVALKKRAAAGSVPAKKALVLASRARKGDRRAKAVLQAAAGVRGGSSTPPKGTIAVQVGTRRFRFTRGQL